MSPTQHQRAVWRRALSADTPPNPIWIRSPVLWHATPRVVSKWFCSECTNVMKLRKSELTAKSRYQLGNPQKHTYRKPDQGDMVPVFVPATYQTHATSLVDARPLHTLCSCFSV